MFEKSKLKKVSDSLSDIFMNEFRLVGCSITSGYLKTKTKYTGTYVKIKSMNETLLRELGDRGEFNLSYRLDNTLKLVLVFSCGVNDDDYEFVRRHFYEYEEDNDYEDYPEDLVPYNNLHLTNYTEDNLTEFTYTLTNVTPNKVHTRAKNLLDHVFNSLDIYLEELLEAYGELDEEE